MIKKNQYSKSSFAFVSFLLSLIIAYVFFFFFYFVALFIYSWTDSFIRVLFNHNSAICMFLFYHHFVYLLIFEYIYLFVNLLDFYAIILYFLIPLVPSLRIRLLFIYLFICKSLHLSNYVPQFLPLLIVFSSICLSLPHQISLIPPSLPLPPHPRALGD